MGHGESYGILAEYGIAVRVEGFAGLRGGICQSEVFVGIESAGLEGQPCMGCSRSLLGSQA
jgi:hypothetical protein